jgi:hypothetical protein
MRASLAARQDRLNTEITESTEGMRCERHETRTRVDVLIPHSIFVPLVWPLERPARAAGCLLMPKEGEDPFLWRLRPLGARRMRAWSRRAQQCCMRYAVLVTIVLGLIYFVVSMAMGLGAYSSAMIRTFHNYKQMEAERMTSADPSALGRLTEGLERSFYELGEAHALMSLVICITQLVVLFFVQRAFKRKMLAQMHPPQPPGPAARA